MATQGELVGRVNVLNDKLTKVGTEIDGLQTTTDELKVTIQELRDVIAAGGDVSPELETAVSAVEAKANELDEKIPDAPTPEPI